MCRRIKMATKKPRKKKCKACGVQFQPERPFQEVCKPIPCALVLARIKQKKKDDAAHRERKKDLKPISHWLKVTQIDFNRYIVLRDKELPCISCGEWDVEEFHAGHYRSRGAASHLRFTEDNCWKQCSKCNTHLSGNQERYRVNLVNLIGTKRVEALENSNSPKSWEREELEEIRVEFKRRCKEIE
jgi:hypothetical protein